MVLKDTFETKFISGPILESLLSIGISWIEAPAAAAVAKRKEQFPEGNNPDRLRFPLQDKNREKFNTQFLKINYKSSEALAKRKEQVPEGNYPNIPVFPLHDKKERQFIAQKLTP